jgi:hypothetical protein
MGVILMAKNWLLSCKIANDPFHVADTVDTLLKEFNMKLSLHIKTSDPSAKPDFIPSDSKLYDPLPSVVTFDVKFGTCGRFDALRMSPVARVVYDAFGMRPASFFPSSNFLDPEKPEKMGAISDDRYALAEVTEAS